MKRTPNDQPRRPRTVYLTDAAWEAIEAMGARKGYSRSEMIEQAVRQNVAMYETLPAEVVAVLRSPEGWKFTDSGKLMGAYRGIRILLHFEDSNWVANFFSPGHDMIVGHSCEGDLITSVEYVQDYIDSFLDDDKLPFTDDF